MKKQVIINKFHIHINIRLTCLKTKYVNGHVSTSWLNGVINMYGLTERDNATWQSVQLSMPPIEITWNQLEIGHHEVRKIFDFCVYIYIYNQHGWNISGFWFANKTSELSKCYLLHDVLNEIATGWKK